MSENVKNFINSVQQKDYTAAKDMFQGAMAEKISAAFENKKIELASQMTEGTQINEATVSVELMNSDDEEELTDLMNHTGIEATSMNGSGNKYTLTFKNRKDAQKYAKELEDMGITKQDPKVK